MGRFYAPFSFGGSLLEVPYLSVQAFLLVSCMPAAPDSPLANFQFSTIGRPPSLLGRLRPADPNTIHDPEIDAPPSPPPAARTNGSSASLGRLASLLDPKDQENIREVQAPSPVLQDNKPTTSSQPLESTLAYPEPFIRDLPPQEAAKLLWQANNAVPANALTMPPSVPTSFYFRATPNNTSVAAHLTVGPSIPTPALVTAQENMLPAKSAATVNASSQAPSKVRDAPSRPPETQHPYPRTTNNSLSIPSTSVERIRLHEELRDSKIELDEIRRVRERVADEYKEFRHRYQETVHALEREKAQMERLVAATDEWFTKSEKMIERREQKLVEEHALCAKRVQDQERDRELDVERAEAEEEKLNKAEEGAKNKWLKKEEMAKKKKQEGKEQTTAETVKKVSIEQEARDRAANTSRETEERGEGRAARAQLAGAIPGEQAATGTTNASMALIMDLPPNTAENLLGGLVYPQAQADIATRVSNDAAQSSGSSTLMPLSLGQPSLEVRPVTPFASGVNSGQQSGALTPMQGSPALSASSLLRRMPSQQLPTTPPHILTSLPNDGQLLSGATRPQRHASSPDKEERLKAKLLEKNKFIHDASPSQAPATSVEPTTKPSHTAVSSQGPPPVSSSVATVGSCAAASSSTNHASARDRLSAPLQSVAYVTQPIPADQGSGGHPAPSVAFAQASKPKRVAKEQSGGSSVVIKPEPSPPPSLDSPPPSPLRPEALAPAAVASPSPVADSIVRAQLPNNLSSTLPQNPEGPPPLCQARKPQPIDRIQSKGRIRGNNDGGGWSTNLPTESKLEEIAYQADSRNSRHSSIQNDTARPQQASVITDELASVPDRPNYMHNYHALHLHEDEPWNTAARPSMDFDVTENRSMTPPEGRPRYGRNYDSPSPTRWSSYDRRCDRRYSPRPPSPSRPSLSPIRKRLREDEHERDFLPPPSRRARYNNSGSEASPRQRYASPPGRDQDRHWERPRSVSPPRLHNYPPSPRMQRRAPDVYRPGASLATRRSPSPPRRPPRSPIRNPSRDIPRRPTPDNRGRGTGPPASRASSSSRPPGPVTPPLPAPLRPMSPPSADLMQRISKGSSIKLLARMTDAPASSRVPEKRPRVDRTRFKPAAGSSDTTFLSGRGEAKRGRGRGRGKKSLSSRIDME